MTCQNPRCRKGWVPIILRQATARLCAIVRMVPCPDCIGGAAYCCDGDRACAEDAQAGDGPAPQAPRAA